MTRSALPAPLALPHSATQAHRDRIMRKLAAIYPLYAFDANKGYPTAKHLAALKRHGPCPEHRVSYAPVAAALHSTACRPCSGPAVAPRQ